MSAIYNPVIQQNATWEITMELRNPSTDGGITPGTPFNLTNYTGQCQIRSAVDGTVLTSPTITIVDAVNGQLKIFISNVQSASLPVTSTSIPPRPPLHVYDALIANADRSRVIRILKGNVTVEPGVTQWIP